MTEFPIPSSNIHHSPSENSLTLDPPFDLLKTTNILSIYNLSKNVDIYNYKNPMKHTLFIPTADRTQAFDISITDGVLTYIEDAGMENTDDIQIIVNVDPNSLSTTTNLFTNETVAASGTKTSTTPIQTGQLSKLLCYVSNSGASDNVTVSIYASPTDSTTGRRRAITPPFTLGAGNVTTYETGCGIDPKQLDNYVWGEITNGGTVDAVITVEFSMFR